MITLPMKLEKRLKASIPRARDREKFAADAVERALDHIEASGDHGVQAVGGTLHLYCDGGSRGNPGDAAIGYVIKDPETSTTLKEYKEAIGIATNNVAEYRALIAGLSAAVMFQPNRLICYLDSELVVKQVAGEYRVKMPTLQPLVEEVQELSTQLKNVSFAHIPRAENAQADRLVNEALDLSGNER